MKINELHDIIAAAAPIFGVSSNGEINFKPAATAGQRAAATALMTQNLSSLITTYEPPDLSNVDNLERSIKALALCVAQVGGLTVPQMKTLFKNKWDSLA